jgi:hypothetical protein
MNSRPDTIAEHDRKVLTDAARKLETAARALRLMLRTGTDAKELKAIRWVVEAALEHLK